MKKMISLILACAIIMTISLPAVAAETNMTIPDKNEATRSAVALRVASAPTAVGTLPYLATVTNLNPGFGTYTRFYFYPSGNDIQAIATFYACENQTQAFLRAKITLYESGSNTLIDSATSEYFSKSATIIKNFRNLETNKAYYFLIENISSYGFNGAGAIWGEPYFE